MNAHAPAALVTGAGRRIGREIALDLARHGGNVAVHIHRSESEAEAVAAEIRGLGRSAATVRADLEREAETTELVGAATRAIGPLDLLVNSASVFEREGFLESTRASWDRHIETNLRAPYVLTQAFALALQDGVPGNVVHLVDHHAAHARTGHFVYLLSKSALLSLTRMQALALAPRVRVNAIGPGLTLPSVYQTAAAFAADSAATPLGRGTTPAEIAAAIRFLVASPSMTGQMLTLDGGSHLA